MWYHRMSRIKKENRQQRTERCAALRRKNAGQKQRYEREISSKKVSEMEIRYASKRRVVPVTADESRTSDEDVGGKV